MILPPNPAIAKNRVRWRQQRKTTKKQWRIPKSQFRLSRREQSCFFINATSVPSAPLEIGACGSRPANHSRGISHLKQSLPPPSLSRHTDRSEGRVQYIEYVGYRRRGHRSQYKRPHGQTRVKKNLKAYSHSRVCGGRMGADGDRGIFQL